MITSSHIIEKLEYFRDSLPKFPDGRIDYTHSMDALVVNMFVVWRGKLLIVRRSKNVSNYVGKWHIIAGFFDEEVTPEEKAREELAEEVHIQDNDIQSITVRDIVTINDPENGKTWHVVPMVVQLSRLPGIELDWEHDAYEWIDPKDLLDYDVIYGLRESFNTLAKLI